MRKFAYILLLLLAPATLSAQVSKQVQVEKNYTPSVNAAQKLAIVPDMTDTVMMRPEVDYIFTPRSYETSLLTKNFKPATISYWDFMRSRLLYVKGAAGVPLASEADAYISTYNKDKGYAMAYANHTGDYRNRYSISGMKVEDNTSEMSNRVGLRGGLFVGRHLLEVDIFGDHQMRHRYPTTGERIGFGKMQGKVRIGDDFSDLSKWNFNVELGGGLYDHSAEVESAGALKQSDWSVNAAVGKMLGNHLLKIHLSYDGIIGGGALEYYRNTTLMAGARYGFESARFDIIIGADYYHDKVKESTASPHQIFPYLRMAWKSATQGFAPYIEVDGGLKRHDFGSLSYYNPYVMTSSEVVDKISTTPNESAYNGRIGVSGNVGKGVFAYNLSAELSFADDHLYWYNDGADYLFESAYQQSLRLDGSIKLRPVGWFEADLSVGAYVWENYDDFFASRPNFQAALGLRYTGRRLSVGANLGFNSAIKWMTLAKQVTDTPAVDASDAHLPSFVATKTNSTFTLGLDAEWRINERWAVFAEGRNLTGSKVYDWLHYYRDTAQCLVGVKFNL